MLLLLLLLFLFHILFLDHLPLLYLLGTVSAWCLVIFLLIDYNLFLLFIDGTLSLLDTIFVFLHYDLFLVDLLTTFLVFLLGFLLLLLCLNRIYLIV
jgi:hypothetical protein